MHRCPQTIKEKAYKSTVRPKLEYCSTIWDPYQQKYIAQIEMVQKRAARFVKNMPHRNAATSQPSATAMVADLGWETLQARRHNNRLSLLYKMTNGLVEIPPEYHPAPRNTRVSRVHDRQYLRHQVSVDAYKDARIQRTIADWNNLPEYAVEANTLEDFKSRLSEVQRQIL